MAGLAAVPGQAVLEEVAKRPAVGVAARVAVVDQVVVVDRAPPAALANLAGLALAAGAAARVVEVAQVAEVAADQALALRVLEQDRPAAGAARELPGDPVAVALAAVPQIPVDRAALGVVAADQVAAVRAELAAVLEPQAKVAAGRPVLAARVAAGLAVAPVKAGAAPRQPKNMKK